MHEPDHPGPYQLPGPLLRCSVAAYQTRRRAEGTRTQAAWQHSRLAGDVERRAELAAVAVPSTEPGTDDEPGTGWETHLVELPRRIERLATVVSSSARGNAATLADYQHAWPA
ncbi:hypothetical protein ABT061_23370 [Streptosporangium sp. NPDC002544]|uniref:hypothetical protein n=1 Tax=Streptosporangium sp. NPDC002544 TaxID=3154538 RepID=UPI0033234818